MRCFRRAMRPAARHDATGEVPREQRGGLHREACSTHGRERWSADRAHSLHLGESRVGAAVWITGEGGPELSRIGDRSTYEK